MSMDLQNEGYYQGTVVSGQVDRAGKDQLGNYQYVLRNRITAESEDPDDPAGPYREIDPFVRNIYLTFTEAAAPIAFEVLATLGFNGESIKDLADFQPKGTNTTYRCQHDIYKGKVREKWSVAKPPRAAIEDLEDFEAQFGETWDTWKRERGQGAAEFFEAKAQDREKVTLTKADIGTLRV